MSERTEGVSLTLRQRLPLHALGRRQLARYQEIFPLEVPSGVVDGSDINHRLNSDRGDIFCAYVSEDDEFQSGSLSSESEPKRRKISSVIRASASDDEQSASSPGFERSAGDWIAADGSHGLSSDASSSEAIHVWAPVTFFIPRICLRVKLPAASQQLPAWTPITVCQMMPRAGGP